MSKYIANSVQVPNAFFDELMPSLSDAALRCYLVIVRQTIGWQKQHDYISISQFMKKTGKARATVVKGCDELEDLGLIVKVVAKNRISRYSLNLFKGCTSSKSELVQDLNGTSSRFEQEVVQDLNTQKPNKPTYTKPNKKNKQKKEIPKTFKPEKPESVSYEIWSDLLTHRKSKRCSETQTAWNVIFSQLGKAQKATGHNLDTIISEWMARDWKGFKTQWYINAQSNNTQNTGQSNANNQRANRQISDDEYFDNLMQSVTGNDTGKRTERTVN